MDNRISCVSECKHKLDKKRNVARKDGIKREYVTSEKQDAQDYSLKGAQFTVGIWDDDPAAIFTIKVVALLSTTLNFSFNVKAIDALEAPETVAEKAEVDIFGLLTVLHERMKYMTFLHPVAYTPQVFVTKRNKLQGFHLTDPFSTPVWLLLITYGLLTGPIMHCLDRQTKTTSDEHGFSQIHCKTTNTPVAYYVQYTLASFLQQGGTYLPRHLPARIITGCWWLFAIIVVAMYTGTLVSKLFVSEQQHAFSTLQELVDSDIVPVTLGDFAPTLTLKNSPPNTDYGKLWKKMETDDAVPVNDTVTAFDLTATGRYTFFCDDIYAKLDFITDLKLHEKCRFSLAPVATDPIQLSFAVPRRSNYTEALNYGFAILLQSDMINQLLEETLHPSQHCLNMPSQTVGAQAILVDQLSTAFWVILLGMSVALFTFVMESVHYRIKMFMTSRITLQTVS